MLAEKEVRRICIRGKALSSPKSGRCAVSRTDSRYLMDDMEAGVSTLVEAAANICGVAAPPKHHTENSLISAMETAARRICRRTRNAVVSAHLPPAPLLWKSWCPLGLWSGKSKENRLPSPHAPGHGTSPKDVQDLLCHSSVNTTTNIYTHAKKETKRSSARSLGKIVGEG